jgi:RND family efflux transporter MFP subunit
VDEQEDYYQSALEAENSAKLNVNTAREKAGAAHAKVDQALADLDEAKAEVSVAQAERDKSKVLLDYTVIRSPFTGVVTKRNFHPGKDGRPGDFIKAADQGGTVPLLAVERTDLMRVVIQVPDRDVPYVSLGDPAVIEIDALPGVEYKTRDGKTVAVSRWADAEDPTTRTMRTEVDVPNPDGKLRHGMYGRATLILSEGTPNALRVPSAALVGKSDGGRGAVRVVRDGAVHLVPVRYATDNGLEVEVVSGLAPTDSVIVRATGPVEEGTPVAVADATEAAH